jgi:hypothetical protein
MSLQVQVRRLSHHKNQESVKHCFNNGRNSALYSFSSLLVVIKTVYILSLTQKYVTIQ